MKKKQKIILLAGIVLTLALLICWKIPLGKKTEEEIAREHLARHSLIPGGHIEMMAIRKEWQPDQEEWMLYFHYPEVLDLNGALVEVWISQAEGSVTHCSCEALTQEKYDQSLAYYQAVLPSLQAAREWEEEYGPYTLWNAKVNNAFYQAYGYVPYASQQDYEMGAMPEKEKLFWEDALPIAEGILADHFQDLLNEKKDLQLGYHTKSENADSYLFDYYWKNEQGELENVCYVIIDAFSGQCIHAFRYCLLEGEDRLPLSAYYSDIYYFVPMEDGSYWRNDLL